MSAYSQRDFLQTQIAATDRLLSMAGNHPLMAPTLAERRDSLRQQLDALAAEPRQPRSVLFFTGQPVLGSVGIDADFAAKVLQPFLDMVKTQYATTKHGAVGARGPRRDESEAKLLLTALPRGSFGLELSQPHPHDLFSSNQLIETIVRVTEVIKAAGNSDEAFTLALEEVSPRVLTRLKDFLETIANGRAGMRIVSGDVECSLDQRQVSQAFERVSGAHTDERMADFDGTFRGATLDSWRFDFRLDDENTMSGPIGDNLTPEDVETMIRQLTNQPCTALIHVTKVTMRSGAVRARYELRGLKNADRAVFGEG
jgi:hypothetical protein